MTQSVIVDTLRMPGRRLFGTGITSTTLPTPVNILAVPPVKASALAADGLFDASSSFIAFKFFGKGAGGTFQGRVIRLGPIEPDYQNPTTANWDRSVITKFDGVLGTATGTAGTLIDNTYLICDSLTVTGDGDARVRGVGGFGVVLIVDLIGASMFHVELAVGTATEINGLYFGF